MSTKESFRNYLILIPIQLKYLSLSSLLILVSLFGDHLLSIKRTSINSYLIAFSDNLIHAFIAYFSWLLVYVSKGQPIYDTIVLMEALICGLTAAAIDLDHVITARSIDLKIISQLSNRPFLHNTTLMVFISIAIISMGLFLHNWMCQTYGWMFLTAGLTHHLRDALRHGFWFYPFRTKPVPFWAYVLLLTSYPMICSLIMDIVAKEWLERYSTKRDFKYKALNLEVEEV